MTAAKRIDAAAAWRSLQAGDALLVCAYEDSQKCARLGLKGAITLSQLRARSVEKDRELIFFCA
jgi:hypothetical protein